MIVAVQVKRAVDEQMAQLSGAASLQGRARWSAASRAATLARWRRLDEIEELLHGEARYGDEPSQNKGGKFIVIRNDERPHARLRKNHMVAALTNERPAISLKSSACRPTRQVRQTRHQEAAGTGGRVTLTSSRS